MGDFLFSDREAEFYERMGVPAPKTSVLERVPLMMSFRNERKLYKRKCDATGKDIISAYPADSQFTVYHTDQWWSDSWDPLKFGFEFDFNRPFFDQFDELQKIVPRIGTSIFNCENCDYNSHVRHSRNCYLSSLSALSEDILYSYWIVNSKDIADSTYTNHSTQCYKCNNINYGYNCIVLEESDNCTDCFFSYQLRGCQNCIFCHNLANKNYYIFNKPYSKEEFQKIKDEIINGSYFSFQKAYQDFLKIKRSAIQRHIHSLKCENCVGDHIYNSKNCNFCFDTYDSEDCFNSISLGDTKDVFNSYSVGWTRCENVHLSSVLRGSTNLAFCTYCWTDTDLRYCDSTFSSNNCFGCIGLKHHEYCIMNKAYSKGDYDALVKKIITHMEKTGEWGEFFPPKLSPYAYNETPANDFFPISKEEALKKGYRWREEDAREFLPATIGEIPDNINNINDDIFKAILACATCKKNYRIIPQELAFYKRVKVPLPRNCPDCRHSMRMKLRNPLHLWKRPCAKCNTEMETSFSPDRKETVYCDKCYLEEVY